MTYRTTLLLLALLAACAPGGGGVAGRPETVRIRDAEGATLGEVTQTDPEWAATATVAFPIELVWAALPAAFDSLGIRVTQLQPAARTAGNPALRPRRQLGKAMLHEYIDCGRTQGDLSADTYEIRLSVLSSLRPAQQAGSTVLQTTVTATGKPMGLSGNWVQCSSQGKLEKALLDVLTRGLRRGTS